MKTKKSPQSHPTGLPEFLAALAIFLLLGVIILTARSCGSAGEGSTDSLDSAPAPDSPTTTELNPIDTSAVSIPLQLTDGITVDRIYTATGYFPEDGTDEAVENVLAARFTNTTDRTIEYMTAALTVNGETYTFALTTIPAGASVYAYDSARRTAPASVTSLEGSAEYEIYFAEEPDTMPDTLSYEIRNGTIVVTNISGEDIPSDIMVYYKSVADSGYLGGITYRFRVEGGLKAGESFNGYAPHAYAHMTEVMFAQMES